MDIVQLIIQLVVTLLITSGIFGGIVYMWKKMQNSQNKILADNGALINRMIDNSERRLDREQKDHRESLDKIVEAFKADTAMHAQNISVLNEKATIELRLINKNLDKLTDYAIRREATPCAEKICEVIKTYGLKKEV